MCSARMDFLNSLFGGRAESKPQQQQEGFIESMQDLCGVSDSTSIAEWCKFSSESVFIVSVLHAACS